MTDDKKTKKQLINELAAVRRKVAALEASAAGRGQPDTSLSTVEDRFYRLFATISDAVFIFDADTLHLVDANLSAERLYGYSREELLTMAVADFSAEPEVSLKFIKKQPPEKQSFVPLRQHRKKDGSIFPVEITSGLYTTKGRGMFYAVVHDITEKKRIEDDLRKSEEAARTLLKVPSTAIMLLDTKARFIEMNDTMTKRFCRTAEKMKGMCLWDILPTHVAELRKGYFAKALSTKKMVRWEDERQGMWNDNSFIPIINERREVERIIGFAVDITASKKSEQLLQESEQRYRTLVESAPDAIVTFDSSGKIVSWNRGAEAVYGYTAREIVGKDFTLTMPEKLRKKHGGMSMEWAQKKGNHSMGKTIEVLGRRKDGAEFNVEQTFSMHRIGDQHFFTIIARDITERKKVEKKLHESEQLFRQTFEHAPMGIAIFSKSGSVINLNNSFADIFGYSLAELKAQGIDVHLHPEDKASSIKALISSPLKLLENAVSEKRYVARDGHTIHVKEYAQGIFSKTDELVYAIVLIEDITARKQAEHLNINIFSKLKGLYNELYNFSALLPTDKQFSRLGSIHDFNLSPMENRVASLIYHGYSNKKIASQLNISENTVKHHITSIFSKFKVKNRIQFLNIIRTEQIIL